MPSNVKIRFGSTRQSGPEHYFRVQVSWDGGQSHDDALVMKRDDRDGQDKRDRPYRLEWAATGELEREAEAALDRWADRFSAKDTKNELKKFLKGIPRHYVPSDAEIPVDLGVRLAESQIGLGMHAGKEPEAWEREADAAALRRAGGAGQISDEGGMRMPELFQWVPWFGELAEKVREGRRKGLVEMCKEVDWPGGKCVVLEHGEEHAEPLTFFSHLASIAGGQVEKRVKTYSSVADVFEIESNLDYRSEDGFIFPIPPAINLRFHHPRADSRHWEMFDQACAFDGKSHGTVKTETFAKVLRIKRVAVAKLTQVLFLINPKAFLPIDTNALLPLGIGRFRKSQAIMSWADCAAEMGRIRTAFPGCQPYEMNLIGYLWTKGRIPRNGNRWYQIGTSDGGWREFRDKNWVHHRGRGDTHRPEEGKTPPEPEQGYRLDESKPGDVVLVRSGRREGRGIGIVYRNDYRERSRRNGRIHVLWVNKAHAPLAADMPAVRFSRVGRSAYDAFAKSDAYSATMALLPRPSGSEEPEPAASPDTPPPFQVRHELNTILYGPPGTGKTWHTVTRSVAIVEGREMSEVAQEDRDTVKQRFEEYRRAGRIEMITFHQNTTYEDFVEGIRPVLAGSQGGDADSSRTAQHGDVQYEMSQGVFRRIAERTARHSDDRYVLIIDEINRGNIARIFGELITLIEDSKRIGEHDEARVTLPGSKTDFGVPANLHILGTMNTADRSIALLDTALRRRFEFEEMMPDPSHANIATDLDGIDCGKLLAAMNRRIAVLLDREHQIGHTYLLDVKSLPALARTFQNRIMPLLQEYFYDDWEKIQAVLNNNGFVQKGKPPKDLVDRGLVDPDRNLYDLAPVGHDRWTDPTAYRRIYERPKTDDAGQAQGD